MYYEFVINMTAISSIFGFWLSILETSDYTTVDRTVQLKKLLYDVLTIYYRNSIGRYFLNS